MTEPELDQALRHGPRCPCCGRPGLSALHRSGNAPVHSCLLMASEQEAVAYPRGEIELAFCSWCGFISNVRFDPTKHEYSPRYEETQHFSPFFAAFAHDLAARLIDRYDLRGREILEIGCGKGEFLDLICELGGNRGIGVDPGCRPERFSAAALSRITLVREWFAPGFRWIPHDVFICRHTLEHIRKTREFVGSVRDYIGDHEDVLVFFEVPDTTRVLREQAFWDVYYEHCSYFTAGSLARLFRACRFEILELHRDFADQYLLLVARPSRSPTAPRLALENDLFETARDVDLYRSEFQARTASWRERIRSYAAGGRRPVVWGGGSKCVSFFSTLGIGREIEVVVDVNPHKQGMFLPGSGHEVVAPEVLKTYRPEVVVMMNSVYRHEIQGSLDALGVAAELVGV